MDDADLRPGCAGRLAMLESRVNLSGPSLVSRASIRNSFDVMKCSIFLDQLLAATTRPRSYNAPGHEATSTFGRGQFARVRAWGRGQYLAPFHPLFPAARSASGV